MSINIRRILFFAGIGSVLLGVVSPPVALALGIAFAMLLNHPFEAASRLWAKLLLQFSVVATGFGMDAEEVFKTGRASFLYTAIGIAVTMATGLALGKLLKVRSKAAFLIAAGTAICGGSAIAAIAAVNHPDDDELAMSMGTVFTLNSVALILFPAIGLAMHLTQTQFGLWAALAIHDTSSVVGAAAKFGPQALAIGTVVKLTRALWILPVTMMTAVLSKSTVRVKIPWFIVLFCLATIARTFLMHSSMILTRLNQAGHIGMALTLFFIGSGISQQTLRRTGGRAIAQGLLLWIIVASGTLVAINVGWVAL